MLENIRLLSNLSFMKSHGKNSRKDIGAGDTLTTPSISSGRMMKYGYQKVPKLGLASFKIKHSSNNFSSSISPRRSSRR
jgi:hypothetical protein